MSAPVPAAWLPDAPVARLIVHWTAGTHRASPFDRQHYHLLIEGEGTVVRGARPIGRWPPHTRRLNTGSVGIALCGMAGATLQPFAWGQHPLTATQMERLVAVLAQLARRYDLPITPRALLSHAEVPAVYGIPQRGKWDIVVWPGHPERHGAGVVGAELRRQVAVRLGS